MIQVLGEIISRTWCLFAPLSYNTCTTQKFKLWHVGIIFWLLITNIYFRKYKFWEDIHRCECVLAGIYQRHGKSTKALRHWEEAYQAACKSGDKESQAEALKAKSEVQHPISSHLAKTKLLLNDDGQVVVNIKRKIFALTSLCE